MGGKARVVITALMDLFFAVLSICLLADRFPLEGSKDYIITAIWACFAVYFVYFAVKKTIWLIRNR